MYVIFAVEHDIFIIVAIFILLNKITAHACLIAVILSTNKQNFIGRSNVAHICRYMDGNV